MASTACDTTPRPADGWSRVIFGLTILLSAFLLFQVQPLVSKHILPWFGGCPAVWTTCLLFFQTALFGGYLYAHLLQRWFAPRKQVVVHLALAAVAMAMLPILPGESLKPTDNSNPTWQILLLLGMSVGLPYFALSATSPLVQAWFSYGCPGRSPYRLYALSNIGSLAALLSYPFVFEPAFTLPKQSALWSVGFVTYVGLCLASLISLWKLSYLKELDAGHTPGATGCLPASAGCAKGDSPIFVDDGCAAVPAKIGTVPGWADRFRWLALPAVASLMLLAGTNHICQDVAVVPFLWVMPLSLYLFSFIICFDHPRWYVRPVWASLAVLTLIGVSFNDFLKQSGSPLSLLQELTLNLTAIFAVCMVCHGELARLKPQPRHLTEFYLLISAGGAVGGLFVALVAPHVFNTYLEWPLGMVISIALSLSLLVMPCPEGKKKAIRYLLLAPAAVAALLFLVYWEFQPSSGRVVDRGRNFFGAVCVTEYDRDDPANHQFLLKNGRITHGCQSGDPGKRNLPTSYYGRKSGVGQAMTYLHKAGHPVRVGAVGLGAGTLAAYAQSGDVFRFYEINPEVLRIADEHFTYVADARARGAKCDVVLGDARLSLESQPPQRFDLIILDAFSGDAIPTHLLTREAFEVYQQHLAAKGIIAVHISNNYLRLAPVVKQLAKYYKMDVTRISASGDKHFLNASEWMLLTQDAAFVRSHPPTEKDFGDEDLVVPLWTDQYSNLFQIVMPASKKPFRQWLSEAWTSIWPQTASDEDEDSDDSE